MIDEVREQHPAEDDRRCNHIPAMCTENSEARTARSTTVTTSVEGLCQTVRSPETVNQDGSQQTAKPAGSNKRIALIDRHPSGRAGAHHALSFFRENWYELKRDNKNHSQLVYGHAQALQRREQGLYAIGEIDQRGGGQEQGRHVIQDQDANGNND